MRIIGIDPGLRACGWGVVDAQSGRQRFVACGTVRPEPLGTLAERLLELHESLRRVLEAHRPEAAAVEQTFVNKDGAGTLKLGQARGAILLTLARARLAVGEYAPNAVKKTVTGVGHAGKGQIEHMVRILLPGCTPDSPDAADALGIALCHAAHLTAARRISPVEAAR